MMGYYFNWLSAGISAFSLFLYAFIYTPLKKKHSIAVLVGGIPGALPCLIGWVAATGTLSLGGWILVWHPFFTFPFSNCLVGLSYRQDSNCFLIGGPIKYSCTGHPLIPDWCC
jgi:protoheme IX farnesyltransferase